MPFRGSGSISGAPDIRSSDSNLRKRKASFTEQLRQHSNQPAGANVLLDPLVLGQAIHVGNHPESPIDNVRAVLAQHEEDGPTIYTEMMHLEYGSSQSEFCKEQLLSMAALLPNDPDTAHWEQVSRWIKYEQVVEGEMTRFSRPYITLLNVQAVLQLRNCLRKGLVLLDCDQLGFERIADHILSSWQERSHFPPTASNKIRQILLAAKHHLGTPPGVNLYETKDLLKDILSEDEDKEHTQEEDEPKKSEVSCIHSKKRRLTTDSELKPPLDKTTSIAKIQKSNRRLLTKFNHGTISATILVGTAPFLEKPLSAFVRLKHGQCLHPDVPDLPLPTKFLFVLLAPFENYEGELAGIGRMIGSLFADDIWRKVALHCSEPYTLADGIEEFFSQTVVIPPGRCEVTTRWEPHPNTGSRQVGMLYANYDHDPYNYDADSDQEGKCPKGGETHSAGIVRTGKLFGGLAQDIKKKKQFYAAEFADFFRGRLSQSLAATIFLFFANITSIITFGAVMERALHHQMAAIEAILCGGISGVIFALFAGQPMNILSVTGPTLVFEKILFDFCVGNGWEFLPFRFWVGVWICVILIIFVATDLSALVGLITRFTEEAFATLISVVFIIQAFQKLLEISHDAPIIADPREVYESPCFCHLDEPVVGANYSVKMRLKDIPAEECAERGGEAIGLQCHFKPGVYMLSVLLTFGTFACAFFLSKFRKSHFFPSSIRQALSDFCVLISIIIMTAFSHFVGLDVPVLNVPETFRPTMPRSWLVDPSVVPWSVVLIAAIPATFYTILIVMDQQITAVIVNRKDNKLKYGGGYHLDLLVIAVLVLICSSLGLPYYVAATVLSVMHIDSLRVYSESSAPGEVPQFLGVKEQRITGILAHILIGLSVFLTPVIKLVPLPVLIGIFLYMGVVSLLGQQFVQRIALLFIPDKHQPDYLYLRLVRMKRVHLFTFIQIGSMLCLFLVKYTKMISMMFPLMLVFMVLIRLFILDRMFTRSELISLDDIVPSFKDLMKPSKIEKFKEKEEVMDEEKLVGKNGS